MPSVAVFVTNILNEMKNLGLDLAKVHIIGYSAGAQLAGMIGTNFKTTKNFSFCRITGLDPAGPFFLDDDTSFQNCPITMTELGRNDANLVDIIHTDSNALGYANKESGHIDFWPNGGKIQAGCLWSCFSEGPSCLSCSHSRAWIFYAESLINVAGFNNRFLAKQCPVGATEFTGTNCVGPTTKLMGYFMNKLVHVSHAQTTGDVKFHFLGTSLTDFKIVTTGSGFLTVKNTKYYNPIKRTAIFFHGYKSNFTEAAVQTIAKAYLERGDQNMIMVDWGKFTNLKFIALVQSMPSVAVFVANILNEMRFLGLDLTKVHIIGHSAGAQLAGMIGTNFKTTKNFSFCRITGLDPAGPFFLDDDTTVQNCPITMPELGRNDANLVDIIHTDSNALGYAKKESGHIDFWPNGGKIQAGCRWSCFTEGAGCLSCSHSRAWRFYAESLINVAGFNNRFLAKQCPVGATEFTRTNCVGPTTKLMGYFMNNAGSVGNCANFGTTFIGNFFLETNSQSPYSKT